MLSDPGHDVFVSYAHADNGVPVGSSVSQGWVTALASNLNEGPNVLKKRLFIDHQLRPGDTFNSDLLNRIERSSLLVLLLSQNYIESEWCGTELEHFIQTHSADREKPNGVYVVELFPYERLTAVPPNIQLLRKRLIHAKFWFQHSDAVEPSLAGYPSALECGPEGRDHYWKVLNELRVALDTRLRELRSEQHPTAAVGSPLDLPRTDAPLSPAKASLGTVLLADATEDLEAQRNAVRVALEPEGVLVLPDGDYVELTPQEFDTAVAADLARADLFVQLLSPTTGRKGSFEAPKPQLQYQRALAAKVPILQWCERLPAAGGVLDEGHAQLFETETLRVTHLADFKTHVIERLRANKSIRARAAALSPSDHPTSPPSKRHIFIDDIAGDSLLADRLRAIIREQDYGVRSLPAGAPLGNNGIDIKEVLRPCRAGLTVYTDRSKYAIVFNRLVYFLNQVADGAVPLARWGVVLQEGTVASEFGIESDEVVPVDENGLAEFLRAL